MREERRDLLGATSEIMSGFFFLKTRRITSGFAIPVKAYPKDPTVSKQHKASIATFVQPKSLIKIVKIKIELVNLHAYP